MDIPAQFLDDLKRFDLNYPKEYFLFSTSCKRGPEERTGRMAHEYWTAFCKMHGIKKFLYHLKHTGNGLAVENGITVRDLQLHNRHSDLKMTQRYLDRFSRKATESIVKGFPSI